MLQYVIENGHKFYLIMMRTMLISRVVFSLRKQEQTESSATGRKSFLTRYWLSKCTSSKAYKPIYVKPEHRRFQRHLFLKHDPTVTL